MPGRSKRRQDEEGEENREMKEAVGGRGWLFGCFCFVGFLLCWVFSLGLERAEGSG